MFSLHRTDNDILEIVENSGEKIEAKIAPLVGPERRTHSLFCDKADQIFLFYFFP